MLTVNKLDEDKSLLAFDLENFLSFNDLKPVRQGFKRLQTRISGAKSYDYRNASLTIDLRLNLISHLNKKMFNELKEDDSKTKFYKTYFIPKRSGGKRQIDEPCCELKSLQRSIVRVINTEMPYAFHNAAFAYIKDRNPLHALQKHKMSNHKYYMKIDFKDFFGSIRPGMLKKELKNIAQFSYLSDDSFNTIFAVCFKDNGLPQGSCASPFLSNLFMIRFDHVIDKYCHIFNCTYTRYADDILVSSNNYESLIKLKRFIEFNAKDIGLKLNRKKTKINTINGKNWNLGLMLNKDNQITIGHENSKKIKAMINDFIMDYLHGKEIKPDHRNKLNGLISYYRFIETNKMDYIVEHFNQKYNVDFYKILRHV